MEARIVREELVKCQRGEGVNHYKRCGHLAEMYTGMIRENKVSLRCEVGSLFAEREDGSREMTGDEWVVLVDRCILEGSGSTAG